MSTFYLRQAGEFLLSLAEDIEAAQSGDPRPYFKANAAKYGKDMDTLANEIFREGKFPGEPLDDPVAEEWRRMRLFNQAAYYLILKTKERLSDDDLRKVRAQARKQGIK